MPPAFRARAVRALVAALAMGSTQVLDNVRDGNGVALLDRPVLRWLVAHRAGEVTVATQAVGAVGGPVLVR